MAVIREDDVGFDLEWVSGSYFGDGCKPSASKCQIAKYRPTFSCYDGEIVGGPFNTETAIAHCRFHETVVT